MTDPSRQLVAWVGGTIPPTVRRAIEHFQLNVTRLAAKAVNPADPTLRAVLVRFSRKPSELASFRRRLKQFLPVINFGAMLAVVTEGFDFTASALIVKYVQQDLGDVPDRIRILVLDPYAVARACADHVPGPVANWNLTLDGDLGDVDDEEGVLLRRAFPAKFSRLTVRKENGGRSAGTKVWRVTAYLTDGQCCEPFIVKSGRRLAILEEYQTWKELVVNQVPFLFRPPLHDGRPVSGERRSLLISMFVTRAQRFDEYVQGIAGTSLAISSLFDGPLRPWRENRRMTVASLGRVYVEEQRLWTRQRAEDERLGRPYLAVLPEPARLEPAFALARKTEAGVPRPKDVYELLSSTKQFRYAECRGHGDLNTKNLFVRWNGLDVILIDFSHVATVGAASRDPARLEVSLAFDVRGTDGKFLSAELLGQLYDVPLLPYQLRSVNDGRIEAIRQIRTHVAGDGVTELEYKISIAAHLLRYARTGRDGEGKPEVLEQKALAYRLAARLVRSSL